MALRFADSFDHVLNTELTSKYDSIAGVPTITTGRWGTSALQCSDNNTNQSVTKILDAQATWIIGFAVRFNSPISANDKPVFDLRDGATAQLSVTILTGSGKLDVSGAWGDVISPSIRPGSWHYLEMKVTINNSTGSYEFRLDGVTFGSGSGVDTQITANASADRIVLRAGGSGGTSTSRQFDDLYVCDGTGSTNNDFLGDVRVECLRPSGNGNSSVFVGSDGNTTDNYLLVDDTTQDGETTYVEAPTVGDKDTYAMTNLTATTATVAGAQAVPYARKTNAGTRTAVSVARLSGTEVDSSPDIMSDSYRFYPRIFETKPGGGAWAVTDINSAEFGVKVNT